MILAELYSLRLEEAAYKDLVLEQDQFSVIDPLRLSLDTSDLYESIGAVECIDTSVPPSAGSKFLNKTTLSITQ